MKLKTIIVGLGSMGKAWLNAVNKNDKIEIVGLVDTNQDILDDLLQEHCYNCDNLSTDLEIMIDKTKPDFIIDVTPPEIHEKTVITALNKGCHVLGEKPMSNSINSAKKMVSAAEKTGKLYMVSQNYRYNKNIKAFRNSIQEKLLGEIGIINADFYLAPRFGGFRDVMESPLILDMSIHTFDAARFITGKDPINVYCHEFNPKWSWYKGNAAASVIFEMTDNVVFTYRGCWCADGMNTNWNSNWKAICEKGSITWDGEDNINAERFDKIEGWDRFYKKVNIKNIQDNSMENIEGALEEFINALKTDRIPQSECHDNIKSLQMVFSAIKSSSNKKVIDIK